MVPIQKLVLCLGLALLFSASSPAATVMLKNGDRLTGEVRGLADGKLAMKTAYAGTVSIDWTQIQRMTSDGNVSLELETGRRYRGTIERLGQRVTVVREDTEIVLSTRDIVSMVPMKDEEPPSFWQILQGTVDVGYSLTRGNSSQTQSSLAGSAKYRSETYELRAGVSSIFSEQNGARSTSRHALDGRFDRYWSPRTFNFVLTGLERNDRQNLDLRTKVGGGLGWTLVKSQDTELSILGGFTFTNEQFRREPDDLEDPTRSSGEGLAAIEWATKLWNRIELTNKMAILPNLTETGRYRIEYDSTVRVPVLRRLSYSLTFFDRFDSDPPSDVKRNDYGLVSAFGVAF